MDCDMQLQNIIMFIYLMVFREWWN